MMRLDQWLKNNQKINLTFMTIYVGTCGGEWVVSGDIQKVQIIPIKKINISKSEKNKKFNLSWDGGSASYDLTTRGEYPNIPDNQNYFSFARVDSRTTKNGRDAAAGWLDDGTPHHTHHCYRDIWILN